MRQRLGTRTDYSRRGVRATEAERIIELLRLFRNVVLEGVPGTGKTYAVNGVVSAWQARTDRELASCRTITLHPSTAYEDTVEGLRPLLADVDSSFLAPVPDPDADGTPFGLQNGVVVEACRAAAEDPDRDHLLVLDELNRANVPKVLGDLLLVIEESKRARHDATGWTAPTVTTLAYSQREFWVPENLFVLATMNTSDRSIAPLDSALRRRFAFARLEPLPGDSLRELIAEERGEPTADRIGPSITAWHDLNAEVLQPCLGPDGMLGHSYLYELARAIDHIPDVDTTGWADLHAELAAGSTADGLQIEAAMWHETRTMTGAADNQLDLTKAGQGDAHRGSVHFFDPDPADGQGVRIRYGGQWFDGSELKYYAGGNGTWRLNLKGEGGGTSLTSYGNNGDFLETVLVFLRTPEGYDLRTYPKSVIPAFRAVSDHDQSRAPAATSRGYGLFHLRAESAGGVVATFWQFSILPQLIETAVANGAEDLLDAQRRAAWFDSHPETAGHRVESESALERFDSYLASIGLRIFVMGSGLGRGPVVTRTVATG